MRTERSFRGISLRAARRYLGNLGGEAVDDGRVTGYGWTADLSAETVRAGGSVELTEVTVVFEGEAGVVEPLVERFARKAMRAGG